jgi:hypothetical protein
VTLREATRKLPAKLRARVLAAADPAR